MAFLGTTDPDGWVICNGVQRTNGSDGRYNNLITLNIGTGTANANNYTPPNYSGAFLRGIGTNPTDSRNVGPSVVDSSQNDGFENHGHQIHFNYYSTTSIAGATNAMVNLGGTGLSATDGVNSTTRGSINETRPYNYGVNWILKL